MDVNVFFRYHWKNPFFWKKNIRVGPQFVIINENKPWVFLQTKVHPKTFEFKTKKFTIRFKTQDDFRTAYDLLCTPSSAIISLEI